jgi:hypothetical protein
MRSMTFSPLVLFQSHFSRVIASEAKQSSFISANLPQT